jgi:CelD/BcsL family acetyltransferase involved in cellulose biosynthesis
MPSFTVQIHRGEAADRLLGDSAFMLEWAALYDQCPWATPLQSPELAGAWYRVYRETQEPILALARDGEKLIGLLPLTRADADGELTVAGAHQAEYKTWICLPAFANEFPAQALPAVLAAFPGSDLSFRYLPPNTPIDWLAGSTLQKLSLLRTFKRPLLELGADGSGALVKKTNKRRLRSMKKVGAMDFQRITDPAQFESLLDEIIPYYDARQLAVYGAPPFADDPLKKPYHEAMMRSPRSLHVTVLRLGRQFASAHVNICHGKTVQLGFTVHNPLLWKHSPGKFHIHFLTQMLAQEGFERVDLTPGGESYKQRVANNFDDAHMLTVYATPARRLRGTLKAKAETKAMQWLALRGKSPADFRNWMNGILDFRPSSLARMLRPRPKPHLFAADVHCAPTPAPNIRRDDLKDLLAYTGPSRQRFMSTALRRIEEGQHVYTRVENGRLTQCGWLIETPDEQTVAQSLPRLAVPPRHALALDLQTFGKFASPLALLRAMRNDTAGVDGIDRLIVALPDFGFDRESLRAEGFTPVTALTGQFRVAAPAAFATKELHLAKG